MHESHHLDTMHVFLHGVRLSVHLHSERLPSVQSTCPYAHRCMCIDGLALDHGRPPDSFATGTHWPRLDCTPSPQDHSLSHPCCFVVQYNVFLMTITYVYVSCLVVFIAHAICFCDFAAFSSVDARSGLAEFRVFSSRSARRFVSRPLDLAYSHTFSPLHHTQYTHSHLPLDSPCARTGTDSITLHRPTPTPQADVIQTHQRKIS